MRPTRPGECVVSCAGLIPLIPKRNVLKHFHWDPHATNLIYKKAPNQPHRTEHDRNLILRLNYFFNTDLIVALYVILVSSSVGPATLLHLQTLLLLDAAELRRVAVPLYKALCFING